MMLVLVLGGVHAPERSAGIPAELRELLQSGTLQRAVSVGDLGGQNEVGFVRSISRQLHAVRGESDGASALPERETFAVGRLRFGVTPAHSVVPFGDTDAIDATRRALGVDVLCTSGTGRRGLVRSGSDGLIVDPGSASGAPSIATADCSTAPGFVILDVHGTTVTCYSYSLENDDISVEKSAWQMEEPAHPENAELL
jgi:vacuolar protein sorting-associated protein 29